MIQESEIRENLAKVLSRRMSIDAFRSWLNARSLNMHLDSSPPARKLAGMVGLVLAEHLIGDRTENEVVEALGGMAANTEASLDMLPPGVERLQLPTRTSTARVSRRELLVTA